MGVTKYQNSSKIYGINYDRHVLNETKITTSLKGKSNITYVQFDNAGRTISTYNEQSDDYLFFASKNTYNASSVDLSDGTSANKTPVSIRICPRYKNQVNSVSFSNFQLIKNDGNSYAYDTNGNLTSITSGYSNSSLNTYSGNNITKSVDCYGYETNYSYDSYNNLKTAVSQREVSTNYTYDDYGNVTSAVDVNKAGTMKIASETVYNDEDTENGIKASSYITETIDSHNIKTEYDYDTILGNLNSITDSSGNTINLQYNTDNTLKKISNGQITNSYEYQNENLSSITRKNSDNSIQTYNFQYNQYGNVSQAIIGNRIISNSSIDEDSKEVTTTYGNNDTFKLLYSNPGYLLSQSLNNVEQYKWQYDNSGNVHKYTDKVNNLYSLYDYDTMNRASTKATYSSDNQQKSITSYTYDLKGNVTNITNSAPGLTYSQKYTYSEDNFVSRSQMTSTQYYDYTYESLNRLSRKSLHITDDAVIHTDYTYALSGRNGLGEQTYRTRRLQREIIDNTAYRYFHDRNGNIISVDQGVRDGNQISAKDYSRMITYQYDDFNQLTREDNKYLKQTIVYTYDGVGNITNKTIYPYTYGEITASPTQSINYSYEDSEWKDLLTSYDGTAIEYDEIGNPTSYLGYSLDWNGRQLSSLSGNGANHSYTYDANGLRVSKTVNGVKTYFQYSGDKLLYQETGTQKLYFWYDAFGNLSKIYCVYSNGAIGAYLVMCNSRGDVDTLYTVTGEVQAKYVYDSWGNTISVTDGNGNEVTSPNHIGNLNPIRYRGYYLDRETGWYYLQSRYYNPAIGRFLNADVYYDTGTSLLGTNMFAYCNNNPVMYTDPTGTASDSNNIQMAIVQGLIAAIELDWLDNVVLKSFGTSLEKLARISFKGVEQGSLLFIRTLNTVCSYLKNSFSLDTILTFDNLILEKGEEMSLEAASDLIDAKGIAKGFSAFLSTFSFFLNVKTAGSGAFTKTEDNIMNVVTFAIDIASVFLGPVASTLIPLVSNLVIDISALTIKGLIFMY